MSQFERTILLLGEENVNKLSQKRVIVFGVGGVGGITTEMLVRTGISNITIVDFDVVSESNINRQVIALHSTVGQKKVDALKSRLLDINNNISITTIDEKLLPENIENFDLCSYDYVVDCIDSKNSKIALIKFCYDKKIPIISSMGAGNRCGIPNFVIKDIYDTSYDGLAKVVRKKLKELGVKKHNVVICEQQPNKSKVVGSIAFYPTASACVVCAKVINNLLKND